MVPLMIPSKNLHKIERFPMHTKYTPTPKLNTLKSLDISAEFTGYILSDVVLFRQLSNNSRRSPAEVHAQAYPLIPGWTWQGWTPGSEYVSINLLKPLYICEGGQGSFFVPSAGVDIHIVKSIHKPNPKTKIFKNPIFKRE